MCLQVSSASSGPRHRDSSFTLENSSLWGETGRRGHSSPPREWPGSVSELLHSLRNGASKGLTPTRAPEPRLSVGLCLSLTPEAKAGNDHVCGRAKFIRVANFIEDTGISLRECFFRTKPIYLQNYKNSLKANLKIYLQNDTEDVTPLI